jgi:plastocyanin
VTRTRRLIAVIVLTTGAAACGGGGGGGYAQPSGTAQATVKVDGGNFFFRPKHVKLPAGIDRIELVGKGGVHTLVIQGVKDFKLRVEGDGAHDALKVRLRPGRYDYYCDIPGHRAAGMEGTISVS